jgi:hypothetical protein
MCCFWCVSTWSTASLLPKRLALSFGALLQSTSDFLTCVEKSSRMRVERFEVLVGLYTDRKNTHVLSTRDQGSRDEAEHKLWRQSARDAEAW